MNDRINPISDPIDPADESTAADLRAAFGGVSFDRSVSDVTAPVAPAVSSPASSRFRRPVFLMGAAAAAAAAVAVGVVLPVGGPSSAWAATPDSVSASDKDQATKACSAALPQPGTGAPSGQLTDEGSFEMVVPNGSGTISGVVPAEPGKAPSSFTPPPLPTSLPAVSAVDRRGEKALAVFKDSSTSVACMLDVKDGNWTVSGLMFGLLSDDPNAPHVQAVMGQQILERMPATGTPDASGETPSSIAAGQVGDSVAKAELTFADGTVAQATVSEGVYAAWFPTSMGAPKAVTTFDAQGNVVDRKEAK